MMKNAKEIKPKLAKLSQTPTLGRNFRWQEVGECTNPVTRNHPILNANIINSSYFSPTNPSSNHSRLNQRFLNLPIPMAAEASQEKYKIRQTTPNSPKDAPNRTSVGDGFRRLRKFSPYLLRIRPHFCDALFLLRTTNDTIGKVCSH